MRCEPANSIIQRFGGLSALAEVVGKTTHTVMRWRMPRPQGTGGIIPHWHHEAIVSAAETRGIDLSGTGFVPVVTSSTAPADAPAEAVAS
jgi:hypothetical protein